MYSYHARMALPRGARLGIYSYNENVGPNLILSENSVTHPRNPSSPTFMKHEDSQGDIGIQLLGPNGSFHFSGSANPLGHFAEFTLSPLYNIQELHLKWNTFSVIFPFSRDTRHRWLF